MLLPKLYRPSRPGIQPDVETNDPRRFGEYDEANHLPRRDLPSHADLRQYAVQLAGVDSAAGIYVDPYLTGHDSPLATERALRSCRVGRRADGGQGRGG